MGLTRFLLSPPTKHNSFLVSNKRFEKIDFFTPILWHWFCPNWKILTHFVLKLIFCSLLIIFFWLSVCLSLTPSVSLCLCLYKSVCHSHFHSSSKCRLFSLLALFHGYKMKDKLFCKLSEDSKLLLLISLEIKFLSIKCCILIKINS